MPRRVVGHHRIDVDRHLAVEQHARHAEARKPRPALRVLLQLMVMIRPSTRPRWSMSIAAASRCGSPPVLTRWSGEAVRPQFRLRGLEHVRVHRVGDVVDDEADRHRRPAAHVLGAGVGLEAHPLDHHADFLERHRTHRGRGVEARVKRFRRRRRRPPPPRGSSPSSQASRSASSSIRPAASPREPRFPLSRFYPNAAQNPAFLRVSPPAAPRAIAGHPCRWRGGRSCLRPPPRPLTLSAPAG